MNTIAHSQREVEAAHSLLSQATVLFDESLALTYALVMALAHTPRNELSQEEIDGLCQLERIPIMFEHSRHGERSSCILAG
jgi:hypothetical protein